MENKLESLEQCIDYVNLALKDNLIQFVCLDDAPTLVKFFSSGEYCAYKNTIYVPSFHLKLSTSTNESDRTVATAKLLPWIMAVKDNKVASYISMRKMITNYKLRAFYFLYEYMFLLKSEHPHAATIFGGFVCSRKTWCGKLLDPDIVTDYMQEVIDASNEKPS
jgi:hypothetical protein